MILNVLYITITNRTCVNPTITIVVAPTDMDGDNEEIADISIDGVNTGVCDPGDDNSCSPIYTW